MDLKAIWQSKIGPVPVPLIALGLVVILAVVAWRMRTPPGIPPEEAGPDPTEGGIETGGDPEGRIPPFVANPAPPGPSPVPDVSDQVGQPDTNDLWLRRSIEWLGGQGHATADQARIALQKYLTGEQLSISEGHLRDLAISHFGLPPELPEGGGTDDPVVPGPTPNKPVSYVPPGTHTVTDATNNTYTEIARLWYGRTDNDSIDLIQTFNTGHHAGPFPVGTRIYVPAYRPPKYIKARSGMRTASEIIAKNPPLSTVAQLQELNDGMKFPVKSGTRVRVA